MNEPCSFALPVTSTVQRITCEHSCWILRCLFSFWQTLHIFRGGGWELFPKNNDCIPDLCTLRIFPYFVRKKSENTEIRIHTTESDFLWGWNTENRTSPACFPIASSASLASGHCTSELPRTPRLWYSAQFRVVSLELVKWPAKNLNVTKQRSPKTEDDGSKLVGEPN